MPAFKDITGNQYGRLTVLGFSGRRRSKTNGLTETMWECSCECGNIVIVPKHLLTGGFTKSCGCLKKEHNRKTWTTHGLSKHRLYKIYRMIIDRCINSNSRAYSHYGGRGISICNEWLGKEGFINFYNWALKNGYEDTLTIERMDVNGNYCPENCSWIPRSEQPRNRTNTHFFEHNGKLYTLSEISDYFGLSRSTIRYHEKRLGNDRQKVLEYLMERTGKNL